uniref:cobalt ABC transporter permease n=1 Tax=Geomesophilobacter sediminis TaxID=2798584 RepID=UPI001F3CEBA9|nr:cobalt ABC transporter permease [Geomesophilobacter sediminis]
MHRRWVYQLRPAVAAAALLLSTGSCLAENGKWSGVDEAVVEKIAKEHGREAHAPLLDPGNGDLLLFAFLLAGAAGGFAAGYYWRTLFKGKGE